MVIKESPSRKLFNLCNILVMLFLVLITFYPLYYVVVASISRPINIMAHRGPLLAPLGLDFSSYKVVFSNQLIWKGYLNTLFILIFQVSLTILMTSLGAYFLAQKKIMLRNFIMLLIVFTMFFGGGLIPYYLTIRNLGLLNSHWALILPGCVSTFYLIILRTQFLSVPQSLEESAKIDGASPFKILFFIMIPLSLPTLAVITLYSSVGVWNSWFQAMIFLRDRSKFPLQLILREILIDNDTSRMTVELAIQDIEPVSMTIKYAVIIVATVPILLVYPFLQKYFVKGVMIGALKE